MTDPPSGPTGLLAGAISYTLGVCALVGPGEMALPTPCADWDLGMLLAHLSDSMADLETAIRTGNLDLERPPDHAAGDPVEILRDRAAQLLCAAYSSAAPSTSWPWAACRCRRPGGLHRSGGDRGARLGCVGGPGPC